MNRYFLIIACLQLVKDITPVNPLTTWLPVSAICSYLNEKLACSVGTLI